MTTLSKHAKLTKRLVENLPAPTEGEHTTWDVDLPGFGLRMLPSGRRTYVLQRRTRSGRSIRLKIGRASDLTADQARDEAKRLISRITLGEDPAAQRRQARQRERERQGAPTVADLAAAWTADRRRQWRDATVEEVDRQLRKVILPRLGAIKIEDLTARQVRQLHAEVTRDNGPVMANRVYSSLRAMLGWAVRSDAWPLGVNVAAGAVEKNSEAVRHRYPQNGELERLVTVLHRRDDHAGRFYLVALLTGCRRGELENMRWQDVDLEADHPSWTKPASSTKQRRLHRLPLSPEAVAVLREVKAAEPFQPFAKLDEWRLRKAWAEILAEAQIEDLKVHDLRHWHASLLASMGLSLPIIGSMLGHSSPATTARYAHLTDEAQRDAADRVGQLIKLPARREG